jgi:hypothetical protein
MLPELNLPVNFAGKDGFYWWIGQVETEDGVKNSNRYKVRIVGQHVKSCTAVPVEDLPWAVVMLPVTAPSSEGNSNYSPAKLQKGDWVVGFFMDGAVGQQPIIMGSLQKVTNSTDKNDLSSSNAATECLAFSRYIPPTNPYLAQPVGDPKNAAARPGNTGDVEGKGTNNPGPPPAVAQSGVPYSPTATSTRFSCATVADVACKDTEQSKTGLQNVLTELFGAISSSGGQVGTQLLSSATGTLVDYANAAKGYINRAFGVVRSYIERAKGQLLALIKQGVSAVIKFCMGIPAPTIDPKTGEAIKTKKTGVLGSIIKWLNEQLGLINCSIADLEQKLLDFLTNLITDLLTSVVNGATCVIESIVSEVLSEIESFLTGLVDAILGPLQALLGIIASPLNILGEALAYIFELLGITCTGNGNKCRDAEQQQNCTGPKKKPGEDDFAALDKLIADIQDDVSPAPLQTSCEESTAIPCPSLTEADVSGGEPNPDEFTGDPEDSLDPPDDPFGDDFFDDFPDPFNPDDDDLPGDGDDDGDGDTPTSLPMVASVNGSGIFSFSAFRATVANIDVIEVETETLGLLSIVAGSGNTVTYTPSSDVPTTSPFVSYSLSSDKTVVTPGEKITFTLKDLSGTVEDGTVFDYVLFGLVQSGDFVGGTIIGKVTMNKGVAVKTIQISDTVSFTGSRSVTYNVASRTKLFTIQNLVDQPSTPQPPTFRPPVIGEPEVDDDGKIIDIPIEDPGDPYIFPPFIKIYGEGVGASAKAVLDDSGKLTKILVQRPGRGYVPNRSSNKQCVIDGFVIIRPGIGYTKEPTIYVNGDATIAKAIVDSNGYLVDVQVINKTKTFDTFPTVVIEGSGMGAKVIPSLSCLDNKNFVSLVNEVAPSGVAEVVDCP